MQLNLSFPPSFPSNVANQRQEFIHESTPAETQAVLIRNCTTLKKHRRTRREQKNSTPFLKWSFRGHQHHLTKTRFAIDCEFHPVFFVCMEITENLGALIYQLLHLTKEICFRGLFPRPFVQPWMFQKLSNEFLSCSFPCTYSRLFQNCG